MGWLCEHVRALLGWMWMGKRAWLLLFVKKLQVYPASSPMLLPTHAILPFCWTKLDQETCID
jgi:hypothetical protein